MMLGSEQVTLDISRAPTSSLAQLTHPDALAIAQHVADGHSQYVTLVECRRSETSPATEIVVLNVEVEVPQYPAHDIRAEERIAVIYKNGTDDPIDVLALRESFPEVPHLNLREYELPRSLCLYDVPFRDLRAQWTPGRFISLIREWLRLTARGELHTDDQPLERVLIDTEAQLILPREITDTEPGATLELILEQRTSEEGLPTFVAKIAQPNEVGKAIALVIRAQPIVHGVIRRTPRTLAELDAMLPPGGEKVVDVLRTHFKRLMGDTRRLDAACCVILLIPKKRTADGHVETVETWAFLAGESIRKVGEDIGLWSTPPTGGLGLLVPTDLTRDGSEVGIGLALVRYTMSREDLARFNGYNNVDERSIVLIGGGALGSQILMNAVRGGQGRWTVIDNDLLLPHNLARHELLQDRLGCPKASSLSARANNLVDDGEVHSAIQADVLAPNAKAEQVRTSLADADLILDCSASIPVAHHLAHDVESTARRCSLFLNPGGTDLTLLAEDAQRSQWLDALEMQYYRAVATRSELSSTLLKSKSRVRYGRSCRDISVTIPQAVVAIHAGIASLAVGLVGIDQTAHIQTWRINPESLGVVAVQVPTERVYRENVNGWEVVTDEHVLRKLSDLRKSKLPCETGGILVGSYNLSRRILYIADIIPSPHDSEEQPTSYIRGVEGLAEEVERIESATAGQLHYVGEWHSHPDGHSCLPSDKDRTLFSWIAESLSKDNLPGLMVIVGDVGVIVPYIEHIGDDGAYPATFRHAQDSDSV